MRDLLLRPEHDFAGALFRNEAGWNVPAGYGSIDAEVRAVRAATGIIDLSDRAKIELTGSERIPFLDGLVTADVKVIAPGTSAYALFLNEKSRVLGDLRVYGFPESLVLDIEAGQAETIFQILEKARVSDDVEFRDLGPTGHIGVRGPGANDVIVKALTVDPRGIAPDAYLSFPVDKPHIGQLVRMRPPGESGFAIWSPGSSLRDVWEALVRRGATPIGRDAHDVLRVEAGVPRFGVDMGEETLALEVAPESAISFTKGCYVGQEIVARGTYVGQVRRKLMGLLVDGDVAPARKDAVSSGGREIGFVTSAAWSPTLKRVLALAILRVEDVSGRGALAAHHGGREVRAQLSPLPFVQTT